MTEYSDMVEKARLQLEVEGWAREFKYLHYNNYLEEIKFNNGDLQYTDRKTGKQWTVYKNLSEEALLTKFFRHFKKGQGR